MTAKIRNAISTVLYSTVVLSVHVAAAVMIIIGTRPRPRRGRRRRRSIRRRKKNRHATREPGFSPVDMEGHYVDDRVDAVDLRYC